jgi:hypothetical protein
MKKKDNSLEKIILDIECSGAQILEEKSENETFELWSDPVLLSDLSGNLGAFLVRAILNRLNINEHHVFRWRLDNKYRQYQILNYYAPNCMAETISFSQLLRENDGIQKIRELCKNGFFIKSTLGDGSGRANSFDRTDELDNLIHLYQEEDDLQEKWALQRKLNFIEEFRIHTFNKELIHGLTFIIKGQGYTNRIDAEVFVEHVLCQLPDTILQGTLIGWDIGITDTNEYYVIESNVTGFHPELNRGFQTSVYFGDRNYRSILCAWLNNYFRSKHHLSIGSVENQLFLSNPFYKEFMFYSSIFRNEHLDILRNKTKDTHISAMVYLGEDVNLLLINLVKYMQVVDYVSTCYLIVDEKDMVTVQSLLTGYTIVHILAEQSLFTKDEYLLINELSPERRKASCFQHVIRVLNEGPYFMI